MGRAPCCDKASVKKGPWSPEEDAKLKSYIEKHGTGGNWIALPQKIGLKRCGKSCRLRWLNYLRPNIKHGGFSEEEDDFICSLYLSIGSRWSIIAAQLPGRTDNDIKNYWNTRLKKKLLGKQRKNQRARSSVSYCIKQEIIKKENEDNFLAMEEAMNFFPQFQEPLPWRPTTTMVPFQEEILLYGGNNNNNNHNHNHHLSNGIITSFNSEGQPLMPPGSNMPATYCSMDEMIAAHFQYFNYFSSGFDGSNFSGMDIINSSTITTASPEISTSNFQDISSSNIVCSPMVFNYHEFSQVQQAIPQDCTHIPDATALATVRIHDICTSMI